MYGIAGYNRPSLLLSTLLSKKFVTIFIFNNSIISILFWYLISHHTSKMSLHYLVHLVKVISFLTQKWIALKTIIIIIHSFRLR